MNRWPQKSLGELVSLEYGKALRAEERSMNGRYPVYGSNGIVGSYDKAIVTEPTIVVGRKGAIGEAHLAENGCWPIDTAFYTVFRQPCVILPQFLLLWFRSVDLKSLAITSTIPGLNRDTLYAQQLPVPPLAEQERIVKLLDEADELRKLRAQADRRTADLIPALFHEMFGDPTKNPKRLRVVRIGEVIHPIEFGISEALSSGCEYQPGRIAVLRIANITAEGTINYNDLRYLKVSDAKRNQLLLRKGELLFNWRNSPKWVGKTAIFDSDEPCIFASFLFRLRVREDVIDREFLWFYLNHLRRNGFFESKCRQAVSQANFGRDELAAVQMILPPLPLQKEFAERVTEVRELQAQQAASHACLDALFQSMLYRAFNGDL